MSFIHNLFEFFCLFLSVLVSLYNCSSFSMHIEYVGVHAISTTLVVAIIRQQSSAVAAHAAAQRESHFGADRANGVDLNQTPTISDRTLPGKYAFGTSMNRAKCL